MKRMFISWNGYHELKAEFSFHSRYYFFPSIVRVVPGHVLSKRCSLLRDFIYYLIISQNYLLIFRRKVFANKF